MIEILITSSALILVLAILRLVLRDRISARLQYALWLLVAVRLLVPASFFRSPVSVAQAAAPAVARVERVSGTVLSRGAVPSPVPAESEAEEVSWTLRDAARGVWFAGSAVMAAWFFFVNLRLARRLRRSRTLYAANHTPPVYVGSGIPSPCLFGLLRPAIYLTEQAASDPLQARQIVAHEKTHFRHGDMIWALLRSVCLVVWWFDPLVWLAAALSRQDGELACDEGTIKALGEEARFDYGRTLVGMAKVGARPSDLLSGATTMTTGKNSLRERVARIANAPKMSVIAVILALCVAAVAVGCTFSGAAERAPVEPEVAVEAPASVSASDAEEAAIPFEMSVTIFDPETGDTLDGVVREEDALRRMYDLFRALTVLASPGESPASPSDETVYGVSFRAGGGEYTCAMQLSEAGRFVLYLPDDTVASYFDDGTYAGVFLDILDECFAESVEALPAGAEPLGAYDWDYWEEVDRELADFAYPADIEVYIQDGFDETLPEDDMFGPMTLEDYIYGTDSWRFHYDGEQLANDPAATIIVHSADGRTLWIMEDAAALMIEEADGSITWVDYAGDPVDGADMIRHLLPWARGEYPAEDARLALAETEQAEVSAIVEELGHYGFPGMTEYSLAAGEIRYDDGVIYNLPEWAAGRRDIAGAKVYAAYGTDTENIDLEYGRYWADRTNTTLANAMAFENVKAYYEQIAESPFTDGLSVNGYEAFVYFIPPYDLAALVWYDTDAELIFEVTEYTVGADPQSPPLDELIALAETVASR